MVLYEEGKNSYLSWLYVCMWTLGIVSIYHILCLLSYAIIDRKNNTGVPSTGAQNALLASQIPLIMTFVATIGVVIMYWLFAAFK